MQYDYYKDVLELGGIRNPRKLRDLLRLLAYQVGAELDYVEEGDGRLAGFEFKLRERGLAPPASWLAAYPEASFATVTPGNYLEFTAPKPALEARR
jgi:hypothetical protein